MRHRVCGSKRRQQVCDAPTCSGLHAHNNDRDIKSSLMPFVVCSNLQLIVVGTLANLDRDGDRGPGRRPVWVGAWRSTPLPTPPLGRVPAILKAALTRSPMAHQRADAVPVDEPVD